MATAVVRELGAKLDIKFPGVVQVDASNISLNVGHEENCEPFLEAFPERSI